MKKSLNRLRVKLALWIMPKTIEDEKPMIVIKRAGSIVKVTSPSEYDPDKPTTGGRVVHIMPKQLKKIKEAQENEV